MILELERGFGGLIHVSPQPMRQAVKTLEAELTANGPIADIEPYSRAARPTPVDLESQGVAVIAENISAMFAHQLLASPRPRLLLIDLSPMSGVTLMRVQ